MGDPSAPVAVRPQGWSLLFLAISALLLTGIWRLQNFVGLIGAVRLPILAALGGYALFVFDPRCRRAVRQLSSERMFRLLVLFLVLMCVSVPGAINPFKAFAFIRTDHIKNLMLLLMIAAAVRRTVDLERLLMVLIGGSVVYSMFEMRSANYDNLGRLVMLGYYDANDFAFVLALTLPLIVYFLQPRFGPRIRMTALVGLVTVIYAIVRTGSRGGFLAIAAVLLFITLRSTAIPARVRMSVLVSMTIGLLVVGSSQYWSLIQSIMNPSEDYNMTSETGRIEVWKRGIGYMAGNPLTGVGVANFENAEGTLGRAADRAAVGMGTRWTSPHNSFVEVGAEMGFLGLVVQIMLLVTSFKLLRGVEKMYPKGRGPPIVALSQAVQGAFVGYVVGGFFLSQGFSAYLQVLFGLAMGIARVAAIERGHAPTPVTTRAGSARRASRAIPGALQPSHFSSS